MVIKEPSHPDSDSDQTDYDSDQSVDPDAYDHYSSLNSLEMEWN